MECLICVLITFRLLRQSINMCVGSLENLSLISLRVVFIAINFALKMFYTPNSLTANSISLDWLYIPYLLFNNHLFVVVGIHICLYSSNTVIGFIGFII